MICRECTTQFEGINRCAACLSKRLASAQKLGERHEWSFANVAVALLALVALYGIALGAGWLFRP